MAYDLRYTVAQIFDDNVKVDVYADPELLHKHILHADQLGRLVGKWLAQNLAVISKDVVLFATNEVLQDSHCYLPSAV